MATTSSRSKSTSGPSIWSFVGMGVVAQFIWGSYPVFAKRAMAEVPKFSLLLMATTATMLASLWVIRRSDKRTWGEIFGLLLRARALWGLAFFVVLRSVTNLLAVDMTRATWAQLIYLLTPFVVAILGSAFFGEQTPRFTYRALLLSTLGAMMVLVEDWSHALAGFSARDGWGLAVATFSMISLSVYFLMIRRSSRSNASNGLIMFQQSVAMATTYLALTLLTGEDWGRWAQATPAGLFYAFSVITIVQMGGNLLQITAIGGASPALITSLMPLRLISAIVLGWFVLGEQLKTPWQWTGAVIVLTTVSGYLWLQSRDAFASAL